MPFVSPPIFAISKVLRLNVVHSRISVPLPKKIAKQNTEDMVKVADKKKENAKKIAIRKQKMGTQKKNANKNADASR